MGKPVEIVIWWIYLLLQIYKDLDNYLVNQVIEVVGFLCVDPPALKSDPDEEMDQDHMPPASLVPRLHATLVKCLPHSNPLGPSQGKWNLGSIVCTYFILCWIKTLGLVIFTSVLIFTSENLKSFVVQNSPEIENNRFNIKNSRSTKWMIFNQVKIIYILKFCQRILGDRGKELWRSWVHA